MASFDAACFVSSRQETNRGFYGTRDMTEVVSVV